MWFVPYLYILRSQKDGNLYVGTTKGLVDVRLIRHNAGKVLSTKSRRPLILVFKKYFETLSEARKFEWELKYTLWGGKLKKELASKAPGSSNGRTQDSESCYLGSNPSPGALEDGKK